MRGANEKALAQLGCTSEEEFDAELAEIDGFDKMFRLRERFLSVASRTLSKNWMDRIRPHLQVIGNEGQARTSRTRFVSGTVTA